MMVEKNPMAIALHRLAILETQPLRTAEDLLEWNALRQWVLRENLTEEYQDQEYFQRSNEVTKNQLAPKNPRSLVSRFWDLFSIFGSR
ncbi:hypothetical protein HN588_08345 [Candidatus Bathyarchaeota archaeon]|jgi:hypothetical protein|nr:hypothetical protein [Candidatus Bathyarchaeota archaeon]|tara:strand:+ start:731 stop:994 length:264 start_codon:yes stop_codon:yes gene_type:complete